MTTPTEPASATSIEGPRRSPAPGVIDWHNHPLVQSIELPFNLPSRIYGAMLALWHYHRFLQRRFPLHENQPRGFLQLLAWCTLIGRRNHHLLRQIPDWDSELGAPATLPELKGDRWAGSFSVGQLLIGIAHYHYTVTPMLRDVRARDRVARLYWRGERIATKMPPPQSWQLAQLTRLFGSTSGLAESLKRPLRERHLAGHALTAAFGLSDLACKNGTANAAAETPLSRTPSEQAHSRHHFHKGREPAIKMPRLGWLAVDSASQAWGAKRPLPDNVELSQVTRQLARVSNIAYAGEHKFGVNLFGHAHGELGIGEDVRLVAQALNANDIPFCIINVKPGAAVSQRDNSVADWVTDSPRYAINMFCMTGLEQMRYACESGLSVFSDRYTIGLWPWELPRWPESCHHAYTLVDELWGISRYTAAAYYDAACPVHAMSLPVTIDEPAIIDRNGFGLPQEDYLFIFAFDVHSTYARKNPEAVVTAFQKAFPGRMNQRVGLVLKASHVRKTDRTWQRLRKRCGRDPRIHVIADTLRRPEVLALYKACDCFVSLHRAEGFGRGLAEALLLDLQVIATGHSGNLDFSDPERVALVKHTERAVAPGEYFLGENQTWAEPDIEHAAALMRNIVDQPRSTKSRKIDFSPRSVGQRYATRLVQLRQELQLHD